VTSALAERLTGGRYMDIEIDRKAIARYGLGIDDVQAFISTAIGGENVGEVIAGRQRFPLNLRFPREMRDSLEALRNLPYATDRGARLRLGDFAKIQLADGPPMLRSETRDSGWIYVDLRSRFAIGDRNAGRRIGRPDGRRVLDLLVRQLEY
jgi:Cu(I)/Ag(I) efflux system membrane protein CusA/SilA